MSKGVMLISFETYVATKSISMKKEDFIMINSQNFEVPDFCATDTRQCSECMTSPVANCTANFGVTCAPNHTLDCTCHDICVEEVRLIGLAGGTCEFTQCLNYPPIGPCRLGADVSLPIIDTNEPLKVFVACAQEVLGSHCRVIDVQIQLLILAAAIDSRNRDRHDNNVLIPLTINVAFDTFYRFPDCATVLTGRVLQNALTEIDGSCLVIQLKAEATPIGTTGAQITISGKIIDKLWKHENLWISGIRPYDLNDAQREEGFVSFTISDVFNNTHTVGPCVQLPCP
jgi:hypothetical protein